MSSKLVARVLALQSMSMVELKEYWATLYGRPAPPYNRAYLVKRLAYKLQEQELGGLPDRDKVRMEAILVKEGYDRLAARRPEKTRKQRGIEIPPGTRLAREYDGLRVEVLALDDGSFEFNGLRYRSLTAVMKQITATPWNPRTFFGLPPLKRGRKAA